MRSRGGALNEIRQLEKHEAYSNSDLSSPTRTISYRRNLRGDYLGYFDGEQDEVRELDPLGRTIQSTTNFGSFMKSHGYSYERNGVKSTFTSPSGKTYSYQWDKGNRLISLTIPDEGMINYSYDPLFPEAVSRMSYPGGSSRTTTYDDIGRLSRIHVASVTGSTLMDYRYSYSGGDYHITRKETEHGLYEYEYDQGGRVKRAVSPDFGVEEFTYDEAGRRQGWSYNVNGAVTKTDSAEYRYDPQGSRVEEKEGSNNTKYFYNQDERLARIEAVGGEGSYGYNPDGTRRWKSTGGKKTLFYYTEQGMVGEFDEAGSLRKEYGWSPYGMWGTDPLFAAQQGEFGYYGTDHLGTPQMMVNQRNKSIWSARYKVFGEASVTGSFESNLRFAGQYYDHESGLHQNWNRDLDASRYVEEDPLIVLSILNSRTRHLENVELLRHTLHQRYLYSEGDPVGRIDPSGLESFACIGDPFAWLEVPKSINPMRHAYVCVRDPDGSVKCEGKMPSGWAGYSPSRGHEQGEESEKYTLEESRCTIVGTESCIDDCLKRKMSEPMGTYMALFSNCRHWAANVIRECQQECRN